MESNGRTTTTTSKLLYWQVGVDGTSRIFCYDVQVNPRGYPRITQNIFRQRPKYGRCSASERKTSKGS